MLRFGVFEVDLEGRELRKHGLRVKIQEKPFQLLAALIERPGDLVTREELRQRLWSDGTFVDFDRSINIAVTKLRLALGDSADSPRFVETVPRRGFRFIAPVANGDRFSAWPQPNSPQSAPSIQTDPQSTSIDGTTPAFSTAPARDAPGERATASRAPRIARRGVLVSTAVALAVLALVVRTEFLGYGGHSRELGTYSELTNDGYAKTGFATDGARLYLVEEVDGTRRLAQVAAAGGDVSPIATPFTSPADPSMSPDRSRLLLIDFTGYGSGALWTLPLVGGGPRRVGDVKGYAATWSPDGQAIAYADGGSFFVVGSEGARPRKLATLPGSLSYIRWAPDGQWLRFSGSPPVGGVLDELWEIRPDGSNLRRVLANWRTDDDKCCGDWTRDGRDYVFQVKDGERWDIWAVRENVGLLDIFKHAQPVRLTHGPLDYRSPEPSRDGKHVFVIGREDRERLARYGAASKHFVPYLHGISADQVDFSRDGWWITYVSYPARTLWRSRTNGSQRLQLTLPPLWVGLPRWSPDGQWIA